MDSGEWWLPLVERLAALEITKGCKTEPLSYCPNKPVTRAQMATFLVRAFDLEAAESAGFVDVDEGSVHRANIDALAAAGVTASCNDEPLSYCPNKPVTRAQMATFLARALGLIEVPTSALEEATSTTPEPAEPPLPATAFQAVSAGWSHTCGLRVSGAIVCWGDNTSRAADAPDDSYSGVGAGAWHSCGLRTKGTVTCWGDNRYGQTDEPGGTFSAVSVGVGIRAGCAPTALSHAGDPTTVGGTTST